MANCASLACAQLDPRIVNGTHTQFFPTTGALLLNSGGYLGAICSGTLIGCDAFLTAAHCVCPGDTSCTPSPAPFRVFLQHAGIHAVDSIAVHPSFLFAQRNDIAVVRLVTPVSGIRPTAINTVGTPALGTAGTIAGFGVTRSSENDSGIKRSGRVSISSCGGQVPQSEHVCWLYDKASRLPGDSSNTCSGDSGGPLFVDFGAGDVVVGVTSGGVSDTCLPADLSFDTDVYVNRSFIESNADLSSPTCGGISQVGDPNTRVTVAGPAALTRATERCRKEAARHAAVYTSVKLRAMQRCLDGVGSGGLAGPCPDAASAARILRAADRVAPQTVGKKCGAAVVASSFFGGACATAADASALSSCILASADAAVGAMLDRQYAESNPAGPLPAPLARCQKQIGSAMYRYASGRLRALLSCRNSQDRGRVETCPDAKTQQKLGRLSAAVLPGIQRACTDASIAALDSQGIFGGSCAGATTTAGLAACQIAEHDLLIDTVASVLAVVQPSSRSIVEVPAGTARLRVTLNGHDDGVNDVDLYVRAGAPPTTSVFDARSINAGMFDAIEVISPVAGTWHVLAHDFAGTSPAYQVTATTFQP